MKNENPVLSRKQIDHVMSLYTQGKFEEAIGQIKALNESYPNVPLLFNLIGACYREVGHLDGSIQMFKAAIQIKPNYAEAFFNLGFALKEKGNIDESIESYKKAILIQPNYPDAYNNLGNILKDDKKDFSPVGMKTILEELNISYSTLYRYCKYKGFPHYRIQGSNKKFSNNFPFFLWITHSF